MSNKKSQSAIEFMIVAGVFLFFYIVLLFAIQTNTAEQLRTNRVLAIKEVALTVQNEIQLANAASDGYQRTFTLPDYLLSGIEYNVIIDGTLVYINTSKDGFAISVENVTGQPAKGDNTIRNVNGSVFLNE